MLSLLPLLGAALAGPDDLVQDLGEGVRVNWTSLQLEVSATARSPTTGSLEAVEQLARREIEAAVRHNVGGIQVTTHATMADLLADPAVADALGARTSRWVVREATYHTSGRVGLVAELSLQDALKPWALQIARSGEAPQASEWTGVLIDARGTGARPAYAPRLLDPRGTPVHGGELREAAAVTEAPYLFVTDPAHPAATRAGAHPLVVTAIAAEGADLTVSEAHAAGLLAVEALLQGGGIVVVLDAP